MGNRSYSLVRYWHLCCLCDYSACVNTQVCAFKNTSLCSYACNSMQFSMQKSTINQVGTGTGSQIFSAHQRNTGTFQSGQLSFFACLAHDLIKNCHLFQITSTCMYSQQKIQHTDVPVSSQQEMHHMVLGMYDTRVPVVTGHLVRKQSRPRHLVLL